MAREEIIKELDRVQTAMFMASMADFMDWPNYHKLQAEERKLKEMLEGQSNGEETHLCSSV